MNNKNNEKSNFRRGSVELMILYLLNQKDCYGYEISTYIKKQSNGTLRIPFGSLYPSFYKLIDNGYITDYKKKAGNRLVRVYYHIEESGRKRLEMLLHDYYETTDAVTHILSYKIPSKNEQ